MESNSAKAAALLSQKLRGPIDLQCPHFGEYLSNRDKFNANLAVVPDSVKDEANTIEICKDKDASCSMGAEGLSLTFGTTREKYRLELQYIKKL